LKIIQNPTENCTKKAFGGRATGVTALRRLPSPRGREGEGREGKGREGKERGRQKDRKRKGRGEERRKQQSFFSVRNSERFRGLCVAHERSKEFYGKIREDTLQFNLHSEANRTTYSNTRHQK